LFSFKKVNYSLTCINFVLSYVFFYERLYYEIKENKLCYKKTNSFLLRTSGVFSYERRSFTLTYIRSFHSEHPAFYIPNIGYFLFRASVILSYEHPVFFVPNIWTTFAPNIRCFIFRSSGLFIPNIGLFQSNWSPKRTSPTDVRKKKQGRKRITPFQATYDDRFEWGLIHSSSGKIGK
jgi:hypothetical protein